MMSSTADPVSLLRRVPIFAALDERSIERLAERSVSRAVPAGTLLFATGEECRGLYIVEAGRVRIYRTSAEGREQVLHTEGPGRPVAELPLFDGGPYPASAETTEPSRLLFLPRADFEQLYRAHPDLAQGIIRGLGARLRHLVQVTETLAFRDVAARLALFLATHAERVGEATPEGTVLTLDRTQEELAHEIGTARESVSRAFKQLRGRGLVEPLKGERLLIPDVERLRDAARGG